MGKSKMGKTLSLWNKDCIGSTDIPDESIDLLICDPPFGISETSFGQHYKRNSSKVINGYHEAPVDYLGFTRDWVTLSFKKLKPNGSMYIIIGHTPLLDVLIAAKESGFETLNHCIWKYNFGVSTTKKFVTSHYHVLRLCKPKAKPTFNTYCRFGPQEKDKLGGSLLYQDLEDVFVINKDYQPNKEKNMNKLPDKLIEKLVMYSSNPGDLVCDFFMGNFTTAYVSLRLGRHVCGYEINKNAYDYHLPKLQEINFGSGLCELKKVEIIKPANQGKPVSAEEKESIWKDYCRMLKKGQKKKDITAKLMQTYGRGPFAIKNILDSIKDNLSRSEKTETREHGILGGPIGRVDQEETLLDKL